MRAFLQEKPENPHGFHFVAPSRSSEKGPAPERPAFSGGAPGPLADKLPGPSPRPGEGGGPRRHFWGLLRWGRAGFAGKGVGLAGRTSSPRNRSGRLPALPPAGTAPAGAGSRRRDPLSAPPALPRLPAGSAALLRWQKLFPFPPAAPSAAPKLSESRRAGREGGGPAPPPGKGVLSGLLCSPAQGRLGGPRLFPGREGPRAGRREYGLCGAPRLAETTGPATWLGGRHTSCLKSPVGA